MLVEEMSGQENVELLSRTRFGRLACTHGQQPYVVPIQFAYRDFSLYGFTTVGRKIEWMRRNPLVCVEVDEVVDSCDWASVIVTGLYEELPDTPEWESERLRAWTLLQQYAGWWEAGFARPVSPSPISQETPATIEPIFYRIRAVTMTGRRARIDAA